MLKETVTYRQTGKPNIVKVKNYVRNHIGLQTATDLVIGSFNERIAKYEFDGINRLSKKTYMPLGSYIYGGATDYINRPPSPIDGTIDVAKKAINLLPGTFISPNYFGYINPNASGGTAITGLQTIDYKWHIRGGLLGINLDVNTLPSPQATEGDLFAYKLDYEASGLFDGNISKQSWNRPNQGIRNYDFIYDHASRLKSANFSGLNTENYGLNALTYNKNGGILSMNRFGKIGNGYGQTDGLTYSYTGNKVTQITDNQNIVAENQFKQHGSGAYTYYANGAIKADQNEQIADIEYNTYLNQPQLITLTDGRKIKYVYSGAGALLKTEYLSASNQLIKKYTYVSDALYQNDTLIQITDNEGRIMHSNGTFNYEFDIKDHLGNTRSSFLANGGQLVETAQTDFEPFGNILSTSQKNPFENRFEYQNKERELTFGLNRINLGARSFNPLTGLMSGVDALAEKYQSWSPFNYTSNNPINRIDPDGNMDFGVNDFVQRANGSIYWDKNANSQASTKSGETYLGTSLNFTFNSNINNSFDGPRPPWSVTGDKLTSTINVKGNESSDGSLSSIDIKSSYSIGETGVIDMFKGRNFFPGLGVNQNKSIDIKGMRSGSATFEQHASVPGLEAFGLNMLGYDIVNVAQKLTIGLSKNNLSVSAATDIFPSASLNVNGTNLFNYNQPSFKDTHGRVKTTIGDNGMGGGFITSPSSGRPNPSFINHYKK